MNYLIKLLVITLITFMTSCTVTPTIHTNANPDIDLKQYQTFGYFQPLDTDKNYESLLSQFLKQATTQEMTKRGFIYTTDHPDLLINFHSHIVNKQQFEQIPLSIGYYDYRNDLYYGAWPTYRIFVDDYQEGTLNIDLVDRKKNRMIWQGIATERFTQNQYDHLQDTVQQIIPSLFAHFPIPPVSK